MRFAPILALLLLAAPSLRAGEPAPLSPAAQQALADLQASPQPALEKLQAALAEQTRALLSQEDPESQARVAALFQFNDALYEWTLQTLDLPDDHARPQIEFCLRPDVMPKIAPFFQRDPAKRALAVKIIAEFEDPAATGVLIRLLPDNSRGIRLAAVAGLKNRKPSPELVDALWKTCVIDALAARRVSFEPRLPGEPAIPAVRLPYDDAVVDQACTALIAIKDPTVESNLKILAEKMEDYYNREFKTPERPLLLSDNQPPLKYIARLFLAYKPRGAVGPIVRIAIGPQFPNARAPAGNKQRFFTDPRIPYLALAVELTDQKLDDYSLARGPNNYWSLPTAEDQPKAAEKLAQWWNDHKADYDTPRTLPTIALNPDPAPTPPAPAESEPPLATPSPDPATMSPAVQAALKALSSDSFKARENAAAEIRAAMTEQLRRLALAATRKKSKDIHNAIQQSAGLNRWALEVLKLSVDQQKRLVDFALKPEIAPHVADAFAPGFERRTDGIKKIAALKDDQATMILAQLIAARDRRVSAVAIQCASERKPTRELVDAVWNRAIGPDILLGNPAFNDVDINFESVPMNIPVNSEVGADALIKFDSPLVTHRVTETVAGLEEQYRTHQNGVSPMFMGNNIPLKSFFKVLGHYKPKSAYAPLYRLATSAPVNAMNIMQPRNPTYMSNRTTFLAEFIKLIGEKPEDYKLKPSRFAGASWSFETAEEEEEAVKKIQDWWTRHAEDYGETPDARLAPTSAPAEDAR